MEELRIEIDGVPAQTIPIPPPSNTGRPSEEYLARRKVAGAKLPVIDILIPEEGDEQGHEEA